MLFVCLVFGKRGKTEANLLKSVLASGRNISLRIVRFNWVLPRYVMYNSSFFCRVYIKKEEEIISFRNQKYSLSLVAGARNYRISRICS